MTSRMLLILAGLFVGLWLRGGTDAIAGVGLPVLALLALVLAAAAAPRTSTAAARPRLEDAYRAWLIAAQNARAAPDQPEARAALQAAAHGILVVAGDRVVRAVQEATRSGFTPATLARTVIEMRRSTGRPSIMLRPEELEIFLAGLGSAAPPAPPHSDQPGDWSAPASWMR